MKIGSVCVNRNDSYKDNERGLIHFTSCLESFDEVNYVDWNSPSGSYLWNFVDQLKVKGGELRHFIIPPEIVSQLIPYDNAQKCNETLSRNIAIVRSDCDWIVSTNIDIIPPTREELNQLLKKLDKNTFYTISRREAPKELVFKHKHDNPYLIRDELKDIPPRIFPAQVTPNDNFSLINCCGDFQIAHRDVWHKMRGFEENMIYACFADTNVQKKATLNGFKLEVLYEPPLYHMEHGAYYTKEDGSRVSDPTNKGSYTGDQMAYNDAWDWVELFKETQNSENWGLKNINIEYERINTY